MHRERPFFASLVEFMTSGPVVAQVLEGEDAVARNREVMGATNPSQRRRGHDPQGLRRGHRGQLGPRLGQRRERPRRDRLLLRRDRDRRLITDRDSLRTEGDCRVIGGVTDGLFRAIGSGASRPRRSLALATAGADARAAQQELNALVWCDHTDPALLEPFERQFDVKVNVKEYEGTGTALALIEQSRPGDWDVFVVDSVDVPRVVEAGILAPLPEAEFPWGDIFPELRQEKLHFKDGKMYAAPEKFGYNTLAYNKAKVDPADMRHTPVLWDPKYKGRIAVYDYYMPLMGMVAIGLGMKPPTSPRPTCPQISDKLFADQGQRRAGRRRGHLADGAGHRRGRLIWPAAASGSRRACTRKTRPRLGRCPTMAACAGCSRSACSRPARSRSWPLKFIQYILSPEGQARLATSSCYWAMPANSKAALTRRAEEGAALGRAAGLHRQVLPLLHPGAGAGREDAGGLDRDAAALSRMSRRPGFAGSGAGGAGPGVDRAVLRCCRWPSWRVRASPEARRRPCRLDARQLRPFFAKPYFYQALVNSLEVTAIVTVSQHPAGLSVRLDPGLRVPAALAARWP